MRVSVGPVHALVTLLEVIVLMGVLNLLALRFKDTNKLAASYANLFGLS